MHLEITLTSPLHHGAGNAGNTATLRTEEIILPDGTHSRVPFVSANSLRHILRESIAWETLRVLDPGPASLPKGAVDLLFSGGGITSTGAKVDFDRYRRVEEIFPVLNLFGYAAQSDIIPGTLRVDSLMLACRQNAWRKPHTATDSPAWGLSAGAFRGEEFGTRHDTAGSATDAYLELLSSETSTQMIYDMQILKPGAVLHTALSLTPAATEAHAHTLGAALALAAPQGIIHLGAKNAIGYGHGLLLEDGEAPNHGGDLEWLQQHITEHRERILDLLRELGA